MVQRMVAQADRRRVVVQREVEHGGVTHCALMVAETPTAIKIESKIFFMF